MARPDDGKPELVRNTSRVNDMAKEAMQDLYGTSRAKSYPLERREQHLAYSRLMDHLDDIETRNRVWGKYVARALELFLFCGLVAALVCSLAVEPTNRKRLLRLRIWQWVSMALMITAIFSVVPFLTSLLSWPFKLLGRPRKYWVYYLRKMKRSVDFTLWSCLVLSGWYVWFRPRLKHVYGDVSVVACQQITRLLIALCIGFLLWTFKKALYLKLEADLHYDQLFDRIRQTIVFLSGLRILERRHGPPPADFLVYDEEARDDFSAYCDEEEDATRRRKLMVKYAMKRKWKNWCSRFKLVKEETRTGSSGSARCCNIWMDVLKMRRESVPIWILVRLSKEYLKAVKSIRPPNAEELINDDELLLEKAKHMFRDITGSTKRDIDQFDEIKDEDVAKYNLSEEELAYLFKIKQHEDENREKQKQAEENNNSQVEENNKTQQQAEANSHTQQATPHRTPYKPIEVDRFLEWAVRVHKNCWGLERTLKSSKIAFVKLNRMLSAFLVVLVVIIWLLLSKIVNTGQLALLFAPFLAASFMFENSSKNLFQGIIFAFAMHPFDVGDRVIIEDIQMRVKEVNILTSVFYKYDTGAEVIFPNSKLATTKIVNLDITPDQSDKLDFVISSTTPLENIRDLELTIQKLLDDDLYYAVGTKVVKNTCHNPEKPLELQMSVHFKYLVSYLMAQKKAGRRSEILSKIMRFRKEMELEQNMKEYPLHFIPYDLELKTNKKVMLLLGIQRMKQEILNRLEEKGYKDRKIVVTHIEDYKIKMALYVSNYPICSKPEEQKQDDQGSQKLKEVELKSDEQIKSELKRDKLFAGFESLLSEYGYSNALKVVRDGEIIYMSSPTRADLWRNVSQSNYNKSKASTSSSVVHAR